MSNTSGKSSNPFEYGPDPFSQYAINNATGSSDAEIAARYNQLGLGGSTMEQQDLASAGNLGQAAAGQVQTSEVSNPADNPALQPTQNPLSSLGSIASLGTAAGKAVSSL